MQLSKGREIIAYTPALDQRLTNLTQLSRGTGAKYLECIRGEGDTLIAKQWRRSIPMQRYDVLISF